jgi:adenosine kinase
MAGGDLRSLASTPSCVRRQVRPQQILPEQLHILNVSFLVPALRRDFGGCAGNIAYSLRLLGGRPLPMATLGSDGTEYLERLRTPRHRCRFVRQVPDAYTAQAMIMTDRDNNQITAFHPGAMMQAHTTKIVARPDIKLGIIAPDGREAMVEHAAQFDAAGIPFVFDPGQGLPCSTAPSWRRSSTRRAGSR